MSPVKMNPWRLCLSLGWRDSGGETVWQPRAWASVHGGDWSEKGKLSHEDINANGTRWTLTQQILWNT